MLSSPWPSTRLLPGKHGHTTSSMGTVASGRPAALWLPGDRRRATAEHPIYTRHSSLLLSSASRTRLGRLAVVFSPNTVFGTQHCWYFITKHIVILEGLSSINCGQRLYNYVTAFLTGRPASGHCAAPLSPFQPIPKGDPQGSVISPLLNTAMMDLPSLLEAIHNHLHAVYVDDLSLQTPYGLHRCPT